MAFFGAMVQTLAGVPRIRGRSFAAKRFEAPANKPASRIPAWREYCALIRFRFHLSFLVVLLGIITVTRDLTRDLLTSAAALYVSFNVLLYGGIYTLHAVSDARLDRLHPRKRLRPIASGCIPVRHAKVFGTTLLLGGLLTGYLMFPVEIFNIYIAVLLLNTLYSAFARGVPYLEIAVNAATYPLRYMIGAILAGGALTWPLLLLTFLVAAGGSTLRRRVELERGGIAARPTLKAYSVPILILIEIGLLPAIGILRLADRATPNVYYVAAVAAYVAFVLIPEIYEPWRLRWQRFWSA